MTDHFFNGVTCHIEIIAHYHGSCHGSYAVMSSYESSQDNY